MFSEEHLYSIALRKCNLVGDINFSKLVRALGSAEKVWKSSKKELAKISGIGTRIVREIGGEDLLKFAENELKFCEKHNIKINLRHLGELPKLLNECDDAPAILYQKGEIDETGKAVSVVGTRNITGYGKEFIRDFFSEIKEKNIVSISGLALGADTEVHEQSLKNEISTVAVLAHGFHTLYPSKNKKLSEKILENGGALLTEFNSSQKPDRENFIQRNRIVAGISQASIIVETAFGGGSVSTATFANIYNRDVFALPGKISDKYSQGCNLLIYQNKAATISTMKDLMRDLGISEPESKVGDLFPKSEIKIQLSENQELIYNVILKNPNISLDEIAEKLETPAYKILPVLLELELLGKLKTFSGKQFLAI
ncbi:MAG: DNA-processing protein DprA [Flavobacteriaceae bacterium]|jgi:DNA processing protein|nr:DNA-processing protein DprA [Flavobacteriaceae bacterium]